MGRAVQKISGTFDGIGRVVTGGSLGGKKEKETRGFYYGYEYSTHFLDHLILATLWATIEHRLMQQDHRIWDRISNIGSLLVHSQVLGRWTRDTSMDFQSMILSGINLAHDTTGRLFQTPR